MLKYIAKRLGLTILVMLIVSLVVFLSLSLMPGDPARTILGSAASEEAVNALREEMGLNEPLLKRYISYMAGVLRGDFGISYDGREPVTAAIRRAFPYTIRIALLTIVISAGVGILLGIVTAVKQYSAFDNIVVFFTTVIASVPQFLVAFVFILLFAVNWKLLPTSGMRGWESYVLPVASLSLGGISHCTRMTRSIMLDILDSDYARTARAKGASERRIVFNHVLRNALIPLITNIGLMLSGLLGGSVVIERVFAISGIGSLAVDGMNGKNAPVVMGCILLMAFLTCIINLLVDISYAAVDPRIKSEFSRK